MDCPDVDVYFNAKAWATRAFTVAWAKNTWASYADKKAETVAVAHLDADSSAFGEAEEPSSSILLRLGHRVRTR